MNLIEDIRFSVFIFLSLSIMSFLTCKNSALGYIEDIGIHESLYPEHYISPANWIRKVFKIRQTRIPTFLCIELVIAIAFAAMGPVNILISIFILLLGYRREIIGILIMIHVCLIIFDLVYRAVMVTYFKNKTHK